MNKYQNKKRNRILILKISLILSIILILNTTLISAQDSYLNLAIQLFEDGDSLITGDASSNPNISDTNFQQGIIYGITSKLTSKNQETWNFDLNINQKYDNYYIEIVAPSNIKIILPIDTNAKYSLSTENNLIVLQLEGKDNPNLHFQYNLIKSKASLSILDIFLIIILSLLVLILVLGLIVKILKKKKDKKREILHQKRQKTREKISKTKKKKRIKKEKENKWDIIKKTLNKREVEIIHLLKKHKRKETQGRLQKISGIPKASFSRTLNNLSKKGLVEKEGRGRLNIVKLKI